MEELKNNKCYKFVFLIFIFISIIHIIYATYTMRGAYEDGSFFFLTMLQHMINEKISIIYDNFHTRFGVAFLSQIPVYLSNLYLGIDNKFSLLRIYSLTFFLFPFLALLWNFQLTKRTQRIDILFWNVFSYGILLVPCLVFPMVEITIGAILHFVLWNYLASDINYKKRDIIGIIFLLAMMFSTYEYVALLGLIIFVFHFQYFLKQGVSLKNKCIKAIIGFGSLGASIYNILFMLNTPDEGSEITRFVSEAYDFLPYIFNLNTLFTMSALAFLFIFAFIKKKCQYGHLYIIISVFIALLVKMFLNQQLSVYPMWEQHLRTIPCWALPIIFFVMGLKDVFSKSKDINQIKYTNFIIIVLVCSIFQTLWQCVHTYYWDKNIQYMKHELQKEESPLYIPAEHEELSGFHNEHLRRYIWHGAYSATSILFSDTYEQKTLLMVYDVQPDAGNVIERADLFVDLEKGKMSVPFGAYIDIKNKFWDLTNVAIALDKYNEENNIKTNR